MQDQVLLIVAALAHGSEQSGRGSDTNGGHIVRLSPGATSWPGCWTPTRPSASWPHPWGWKRYQGRNDQIDGVLAEA